MTHGIRAGVRPVFRMLSLPRGARKSLANSGDNLNHFESF
jgi:hypothetical protein